MAIVLKALNCTQCGAAISSDSLKCSSCKTQFLIDWVSSSLGLRIADAKEGDLLSQLGKNRDRVVDSLMLSLFHNAFQRIGWESEPAWNPTFHLIEFKVRHDGGRWLGVVTLESTPHDYRICVRHARQDTDNYWDDGRIYCDISWSTGLLLGERFYEITIRGSSATSYRGENELMASEQVALLAKTATEYCLSTLPKPVMVKPPRRSLRQVIFGGA